MFRVLLVVRSIMGIALVAGLYGLAWDLASRGEGYQDSAVWFFSGLVLLLGLGSVVAYTSFFVNIEKLQEDYASY